MDSNSVDLAFTCGVLIHIDPKQLATAPPTVQGFTQVYCAREIFSVEPEERTYRGQNGLLFKRDFGGFFFDRFADLKAVDYGFLRPRATGFDNLTWWGTT